MLVNSNISTTGLVEKYIGTPYDKVALVADNMLSTILVAEAIRNGTLDDLLAIAPDLKEFAKNIEQYFETYYGPYSIPPTESPNETPILEGAMYLNTVENRLYIYSNNFWNPLGSLITTRESHQILPGHPDDKNYTISGLKHPYLVGDGNLLVFFEGNLLRTDTIDTPAVQRQYIEENPTSITLLANTIPSLSKGGVIEFVVGKELSNVKIGIHVDVVSVATEHAAKNVITLPPPYTYAPGSNNLEIFIHGMREILGEDYAEVDSRTVTFKKPVPPFTQVIFKIGHMVSSMDVSHEVAIVQPTPPDPNNFPEGKLWWNSATGRMSICYEDADSVQWVSVNSEEDVIKHIPPGVPGGAPQPAAASILSQDTMPDPNGYHNGVLWLNTLDGTLHVLYEDVNSNQWLQVPVASTV